MGLFRKILAGIVYHYHRPLYLQQLDYNTQGQDSGPVQEDLVCVKCRHHFPHTHTPCWARGWMAPLVYGEILLLSVPARREKRSKCSEINVIIL